MARWRKKEAGGISIRQLPDGNPMLFSDSQDGWNRGSKAEIETHPNYAELHRTQAAIRGLATDRKLGGTVLILPTRGDMYHWILGQHSPAPKDRLPCPIDLALREACEQAGFLCIDMKSCLVDEARRTFESLGELLWWRDDTHLGDRGRAAVANFIAQEVLHRSP